jgi:hypothetical protein
MGMPMFPPMMPMGTPAIAVADGKVYVVLDGTLYKFNADNLELEAQNTFVERMQPPMFQMVPPPPPPAAPAPG